MTFLNSIGNLNSYTELKRLIAELDNSEINDSLEKFNLNTFGTRKLKCSRLQRGIKLLKGWPSRDSDNTSATSATTNDETEIESDFKNLAAGLPSSMQLNKPYTPATLTVETRVTNANYITAKASLPRTDTITNITTTTSAGTLNTISTPRIKPSLFPQLNPSNVSCNYAQIYGMPNTFKLPEQVNPFERNETSDTQLRLPERIAQNPPLSDKIKPPENYRETIRSETRHSEPKFFGNIHKGQV